MSEQLPRGKPAMHAMDTLKPEVGSNGVYPSPPATYRSNRSLRSDDLSRRDERHLRRLGKNQVLKRRFGMITIFGLSTTLMLTWEGVLVYFQFGLLNGGPAGLVTSYILSWVGFLAAITPLAELASMAPTSSGQYHWVYMLAPRSSRKLLSYLTAWLSIAVWQSVVAMSGILCATLIQDLLVLNNPDTYSAQGWHGTLLIWATVILAFLANSVLGRWLPKIEGTIMLLHIFGFFGIMIPLLNLSPKATPADVFMTWNNGGEWPTMGLAFFVGLITNVAPFVGADAAVHMAEEIQNAAVIIPWNMLFTILFNGLFGFGILLTALFCMGDPATFSTSPFHYPFIQMFLNATQSTVGSTVMTCFIIALCYAGTFGQFATASRQLWAFARDRGPPMSSWLSRVNEKSFLPLNAVWITCAVSILLALINIGSQTALNIVLSFSVSCWLAAAAISVGLLLWSRLTGRIKHSFDDDRVSIDSHIPLAWGPWRVREPFGTFLNALGLCWIIVTFFFTFWPSTPNPTPDTMNFSALMTGFWLIFGLGYYFAVGRKYYNGPIVETRSW